MTTSELWAKAEAEKRYPFPKGALFNLHRAENERAAYVAGLLHVLSLLESETAVEAAGMILYGAYDAEHSTRLSAFTDDARAALAAAVAAITGGGFENG
jgi:uncharacterized protein YciW